MSKVRISMRNIKNILRMYLVDDRSIRSIASLTRIPYSTVYDNVNLAIAQELTWPEIDAMSEEALENVLSASDKKRPLPNWEYVERELKRTGVTLQLLWQEYKESHPDGYQYSRFCEMYEVWRKQNDVFTPIPHKAGKELFVDYSGDKMTFICLESSHPTAAEIFVATLGASDRIYAEASRSQQLPFWIESNINAFEYNHGVTELVIPDNLRSAVTTSDRYEASINRTYEDMGNHYATFVVPARPAKAKDKSKGEQAVQTVQREVMAPLRNHTFFGLAALNNAIWERLEKLNNRPFQKRSGSRQSCYEEIDKPALKPLPATRYHYREWFTKLTVGQNHHILLLGHSYSVPFKYVRAEVEAAVDTKVVEIFLKGELIAKHCRSFLPGKLTTLWEHMPPNYQYYFDSYDKGKLLNQAKEIGPNVIAWVERIFALKGRPSEILFRTVQGALSLTKEFGKERLDVICERALILRIHSYKALRSMLVKRVDRLPLPIPGTTQSHLPQHHDNIRGAQYFA
jgi:transposase